MSLALELGPKGITPMLEKAIAEGRFTVSLEHFAKITPVRRAGRPEDIANAAIFRVRTNRPTSPARSSESTAAAEHDR